MDLSVLQSTNSTEAMPSDIVDDSSIIALSKRDIFLSTYLRQRFTIPDSLMHYIAKNPKNTEVYQKMVECCKYFFVKNPILVVDELYYGSDGWMIFANESWKTIDMNMILAKLWITYEFEASPDNVNNTSVTSLIMPKIYQCDFECLILYDQSISLNELIFLCSSVENLELHRVTVKYNDDGTVVSFGKLVEQLPQLKKIHFTFTTPSNNTSKNTFKELWKIPQISNYDSFTLSNVPKDFDIDSFYTNMKKNKNIEINLDFSDEISEEYKARLEAIVDEIIGTENLEYEPPIIEFPGIDQEKFSMLGIICQK